MVASGSSNGKVAADFEKIINEGMYATRATGV
jgi:hypothetical protein